MTQVAWILLPILLFIGARGETADDDETQSILRSERNTVNQTVGDASLARTLNIIAKKTERGRLTLLLCTQHCPKEKRMVPEWVRNFNDQSGYQVPERIAYHYHLLKQQPLPFMNGTDPITEPTVAFLIGKEVYLYPGVISDQTALLNWLEELDQDDVIIPKTHDELDHYLSTHNCTDKYLLYSAHDYCQIPQWRSIARIVRLKMNIRTIFVRRPLKDHQMATVLFKRLPLLNELDCIKRNVATVLFKRLPLLNELDCMVMSFVQLGSYSQPLHISTPAQMVDHLSSLTTLNDCVMLDDGHSHSIMSPLSELQMEYFTGERRLFHLEQSTAYLVVGIASGVAVVALAISIFWGLNGNAFQSK